MSKTPRILIVDDERDLRESLRLTLEEKYAVATAGEAEDAFKYMADYSVNLVLLDFKMPGIDGITALGEIKRRHPDTEVIMMTAYAPPGTIQKVFSLGAFAFVMKPFDIAKLINTIDEALLQKDFEDILNPDIPADQRTIRGWRL